LERSVFAAFFDLLCEQRVGLLAAVGSQAAADTGSVAIINRPNVSILAASKP
jgi:hypothetical protein